MTFNPEFEFPEYQLMTFADFIASVKMGAFNDYDGHGRLVIEEEDEIGLLFVPSELKNLKVKWFNK